VSSSGRDTNEASPKKKLSRTHSNFKVVVERSRSQRLAAEEHWEWRFNYCKCFQITVRNANNSMLLLYDNSDKNKNSWARLQYMPRVPNRGSSNFCNRFFELSENVIFVFSFHFYC